MKPFKRLIRTIISVLVLAALIVGISYLVKNLAGFKAETLITFSEPLLEKAGIDGDQVGQVAGKFVERISDTKIKPEDSPTEGSVYSVALLGDVHSSLENLSKVYSKSKLLGINDLICLGDLTEYGELGKLQTAYQSLSESGMSFDCLPGDRDLYETVGPQNYEQVFEDSRYYSKVFSGKKFVFFDNSANYTLIDEEFMVWFKNEVKSADVVVLSQPVWQPVISLTSPVMGVVEGEETPEVYEQGLKLLEIIRSSNVQAIIAADHHHSSRIPDVVRPTLMHVVVGAVADASKERVNLQSARFTVLDFFEDGTFEFRDVIL